MPPIHLPQPLDADPVLLRQVAAAGKLVGKVVARLRLAVLEQVEEQGLLVVVCIRGRDDSGVQVAQVGVCVWWVEEGRVVVVVLLLLLVMLVLLLLFYNDEG